MNARSIKNKLSELEVLLETNHIHIIAISETWLDSSVPDGTISGNHTIFRKDRQSRGGGVLLGISPDLQPSTITHPSLDIVWWSVFLLHVSSKAKDGYVVFITAPLMMQHHWIVLKMPCSP